jgi:hypothetical protein
MQVEQNRKCRHGNIAKRDLVVNLHTSQQLSTVLSAAVAAAGGSGAAFI